MKRGTIEVSRHHTRNSSLSSIGSWGSSCDVDISSVGWLPEHHACSSNESRRRVAPDLPLAILASSSPEIHALCKSASSLLSGHRRSGSVGSCLSNGSSSSLGASPSLLLTTALPEDMSQRLDRPVANRVSLSPDFCQSPLRDVTEDLAVSLERIHIYTKPMELDEFNKENIPPHMLFCESSPLSSRRPPIKPAHKAFRRRITLHRRISCDSLPSTREISSAPPLLRQQSTPMMSTRPRHRRNTTQIVLPRANKPSTCY